MAQVGVEPTASLVLSQGGLPVAYRAAVVPDGVEPSFPGCRPGVVAVGPRDRVFQVEPPGVAPGSPACGAGVVLLDYDPKAEAVRLELTNGSSPPPAFQAGSSTTRMASVVELRGLESNQHEDAQSVSSCRWMTPHRRAHRDTHRRSQVRGEGVEPPSPGSKPGGLPLTDPRSSFSKSALRESNPLRQLGRLEPLPVGQGHARRKVRESNPQGSSLDRFRGGCHRQLA